MTYPPSNPGYPMPQQPGYGAPAAPGVPPRPAGGPSRLPSYLNAAVAALGMAAYLASFGPLLTINTDIGPFGGAEFTASGLSYWTVAALVGALLAAVSLIGRGPAAPAAKTGRYTAIIAVSAVLAVLLVVAQIINRPDGFSVGWALWLVLLFTVFQAVAAVAALLFETGALSAPAPRQRFEPYGQYGPPSGYYPGVAGQGQHGGAQPAGRPGYPQYGGYPVTSGAGDVADTPPTGFPAYTAGPAQPAGQHAAAPEAPEAAGAGATPPGPAAGTTSGSSPESTPDATKL